jgi:hypothetical protein
LVVRRRYRIVYWFNHGAKLIEVLRLWHAARGEIELEYQIQVTLFPRTYLALQHLQI